MIGGERPAKRRIRVGDLTFSTLIRPEVEAGRLFFNQRRAVIFDAEALGTLRHQLIETMGEELAMGVLTRFGYAHGHGDAKMLGEAFEWESEADWLAAGPSLHVLEGIVRVTPEQIEFDRPTGRFHMHGTWHNSYEAEVHLQRFGLSNHPICWTLTGYASGYATGFFGRDLLAIETECVGKGDARCRWEIRPVKEWGQEAAPYLRALKAVDVASEFQRLRISEVRFRDVVLSSGGWVWETDQRGCYTYCSEHVADVLGYLPKEVLGKTLLDFMPPDEAVRIGKVLERAAAQRQPIVDLENRRLAKDGHEVVLQTNGVPILDEGGHLLGFHGVEKDITDRKRAEKALQSTVERQVRLSRLQQDEVFLSGDIRQKLQRITDTIVEVFDADFCRIWMTRPGDRCDGGCAHAKITEGPHVCRHRDRCLHLMASSGRYTHLDGEMHRRVPFGCYKIGRVAASEEPKFLTNDVANDPRVHNHDWARGLGLVSFAGYRLVSCEGKPVGVLALFSRHPIGADEDSLLEGLAVSSSHVIQAALSKMELKKHLDHLDDLVRERTIELAETNQRLQAEVAERMEAERLLRENEQLYRHIFEGLNCAVFLADAETGRILETNRQGEVLLGKPRSEIVGMHQAELHPAGKADEYKKKSAAHAAQGKAADYDGEVIRKDGRIVPVRVSAAPLKLKGRPVLLGLFQDITERQQAENAVRQSEARHRAITETAQDAIIAADSRGNIRLWNSAAEKIFGYSAAEVLDNSMLKTIVPPKYREAKRKGFAEFVRTGNGPVIGKTLELTALRKDGTEFPIEISISAYRDHDGLQTVALIRDITARKQMAASRELIIQRQSKLNSLQQNLLGPGELGEKLRMITDGVVDIFGADFCRVWIAKPGDLCRSGCVYADTPEEQRPYCHRDRCLHLMASSGRYAHTDGQAHRRVPFGYHRIGRLAAGDGHKFLTNDVTNDPETVDRDWAKETGLVSFASYRLQPPGGETIGVLALFSKHAILPDEDAMLQSLGNTVAQVVLKAKAEEKQTNLQTQLAHAQKLESVGQLAAGIAHEINTPTQFVGDNIRFLHTAFEDLKKLLDKYAEVLESSRRGTVPAGLIAEMDATARDVDLGYLMEEIPKAIWQSVEGVDRVAKIVRAMKEFSYPDDHSRKAIDLNKAIESTITVARNEWKYVAEMKMNLDPSLPPVHCFPGDINQVILNLVVNAAHAIRDAVGGNGGRGTIGVSTRRDGDWVEIRVSDTGTGIPEAIRSKVFDPFFTTKEVGKGTGQGLAIAHAVVVEKHGGAITFETEVGKGTTFVVRLPIGPPHNQSEEVAAHEEVSAFRG